MGGEGFGPHDMALSLKTLKAAFYHGIRHFDTAGLYAQGRSESLLAKAFSGARSKVFISSKGGLERQGRKVWHNARPDALRRALVASLKRLRTDYLDLFQLHWPDPKVPLDESIGALREFRQEGLIRYWGVGNLSSNQVIKYLKAGRLVPHQVHFNPIYQSGIQVLKAGRESSRCINCVISPLEQGLLASAILVKKRLGKKDLRRRNPLFHDRKTKEYLTHFFDQCTQMGISPVMAVINWILAHDEVDIVIPGPRKPEQLKVLMECFQKDSQWGDLQVLFQKIAR